MEREEVLHVAASAEDAAFVACSSPDNDHAFLGSPADREPSEPPPLSDGDDRDHEQVPEIDQDVDHDSGNGVMTVDDLKQRIIKQASLSLSAHFYSHEYSLERLELFFSSGRGFEKGYDVMIANGNGRRLYSLSPKSGESITYLEFTLVFKSARDIVLLEMDFGHF